MAISVAYESGGARSMVILVNGRLDATLGASDQLLLPRSPPSVHAYVCDRRRFGRRRQRQDEQYTRSAMDHHRHRDGEESCCQSKKNSDLNTTSSLGNRPGPGPVPGRTLTLEAAEIQPPLQSGFTQDCVP